MPITQRNKIGMLEAMLFANAEPVETDRLAEAMRLSLIHIFYFPRSPCYARQSKKVSQTPKTFKKLVHKYPIPCYNNTCRRLKSQCISRQRRWGVPISIFYCKECGEPLIDKDVMLHTFQLVLRDSASRVALSTA